MRMTVKEFEILLRNECLLFRLPGDTHQVLMRVCRVIVSSQMTNVQISQNIHRQNGTLSCRKCFRHLQYSDWSESYYETTLARQI